jgi:3-phenylpropionate/cinnamic acid dioxygenase small subunit
MSLNAEDRAEINELLSRYAWAMADKDWTAWRATLSPDATVDYTTAGGVAGTADEAMAWLEQTMGGFDVTMSAVGNAVIDPTDNDDDTATVRSLYRMVMRIPGEPPTYLEASGWYRDTVVRTADGWRIADRFEQMLYVRPT